MRSQMRLAAALWSLNFLTGCTPRRLLQIATSRFAGQDLASSANSGWLLKLSNGVVVAAAASSGVACAVMLLWVSIVKAVIVICPLFRALRGHDMDHSARLETQGNSEQYRRWRTCGDGRRPEPRMIQNSLAFRPQERDACHDRASELAERVAGISNGAAANPQQIIWKGELLFGDSGTLSPSVRDERAAQRKAAKIHLFDLLQRGPRRYEDLLAHLLQLPLFWKTDLHDLLMEEYREDHIVIEGMRPRQRVPRERCIIRLPDPVGPAADLSQPDG